MRSCREISELVSRSLDRDLPFRQRVGMWLHLRMCRFCSGFAKQIRLFGTAARIDADRIATDVNDPKAKLSDQARRRIRQALRQQRP